MTRNERLSKRERALYKLGNQLSVLSHTCNKSQLKTVTKMVALYDNL